jgi:hypothetical protein
MFCGKPRIPGGGARIFGVKTDRVGNGGAWAHSGSPAPATVDAQIATVTVGQWWQRQR